LWKSILLLIFFFLEFFYEAGYKSVELTIFIAPDPFSQTWFNPTALILATGLTVISITFFSSTCLQ